jgi:hypothetical protein
VVLVVIAGKISIVAILNCLIFPDDDYTKTSIPRGHQAM